MCIQGTEIKFDKKMQESVVRKNRVQKENETRIKIHETQCGPPWVHRMNRKAWFEVLTH